MIIFIIMNYYKISFDVLNQVEISDILTYELGEIGFESFEETNNLLNAYIPESSYNKLKFNEVCELVFKNSPPKFNIDLIQSQNWNSVWESNYQPIEIEKILRIKATFHEGKTGFENEITVNPKMSFGTGHHETTRMVISQMRTFNFKKKLVLDMGCGTGVLSIYAEKLGCEKVYAIDIEDFAYLNALENAKLNQCKSIVVEKGGIEKIPPLLFNIILANINKNILLQQIPHYSTHLDENGLLLLSGFFTNDCDELLEASYNVGMKFVSKNTLNNWACIQLQK